MQQSLHKAHRPLPSLMAAIKRGTKGFEANTDTLIHHYEILPIQGNALISTGVWLLAVPCLGILIACGTGPHTNTDETSAIAVSGMHFHVFVLGLLLSLWQQLYSNLRMPPTIKDRYLQADTITTIFLNSLKKKTKC